MKIGIRMTSDFATFEQIIKNTFKKINDLLICSFNQKKEYVHVQIDNKA